MCGTGQSKDKRREKYSQFDEKFLLWKRPKRYDTEELKKYNILNQTKTVFKKKEAGDQSILKGGGTAKIEVIKKILDLKRLKKKTIT